MTALITIGKPEMIEWIRILWWGTIRETLTADASREYLRAALCDHLRRGVVDVADVVGWADSGDDLADAALCQVYADMEDVHEQPPVTLKAYAIKALRRGGPLPRPRGNQWYDDWSRNIGISVLVYMTCDHFGVPPTRNREQRRRNQESASSLVSEAILSDTGISEKRVENIWGKLGGEARVAFARTLLSMSPH